MTKEQKLDYTENPVWRRWKTKSLPKSETGYCITDIDDIFFHVKNKDIMICEVKCRKAEPTTSQRFIFGVLNKLFKNYLHIIKPGWKYHGIHLIQFEKENPEDGGMTSTYILTNQHTL